MSLRNFHIAFITVSIGLSIFTSIWGLREFAATRSMDALALVDVFLAGGVALTCYAHRAFRKLKEL